MTEAQRCYNSIAGGDVMNRILVPIDGSKCSQMAMEKAKEMAVAFGSSVVLLHVNDFYQHVSVFKMTDVEQMFMAQFDQLSKDILEDGKAFFSEIADRLETVQLEGNVANRIIEYANDNKFDMVIMGSRGKTGSLKFLVGGVAHKVALNVEASILLVR